MKGISIFIFMENFKYSRDRPSFKPPQLAYIIIRGIKEREGGGRKESRNMQETNMCTSFRSKYTCTGGEIRNLASGVSNSAP